ITKTDSQNLIRTAIRSVFVHSVKLPQCYLVKNLWHNIVHVALQEINESNFRATSAELAIDRISLPSPRRQRRQSLRRGRRSTPFCGRPVLGDVPEKYFAQGN